MGSIGFAVMNIGCLLPVIAIAAVSATAVVSIYRNSITVLK